MEPQIKYLTTPDGVNIAYYSIGEGPVQMFLEMPYSHLLSELRIGWIARGYEDSSRVATVVRYDPRGMGLSDRDVTDFSIDAMVCDVEAVVQQLDLHAICLVASATGLSTPIATAAVARQPDRFSHLILLAGFESTPQILTDQLNALLETPGADWRFVTESLSRLVQGWDDPEASSDFAALLRESMEMEQFRRFVTAATAWSAKPYLAEIDVPTLVVSYKDHRYFGQQEGRRLVAGIKSARFALVDAPTSEGRGMQLSAHTARFLGGRSPIEEQPPKVSPVPSGMTAILFADIVDSTALTERLGDAAFREKARELDGALRAIIRDNAGTPIEGKLLGDGVLAVFTSARQAIEAALACGRAGDEGGLALHLGLHAGDVIRESDADGRSNVYGGAVNIASRISGLSAPGEVLVSETVRSLARTSAGVGFEDRGEQALKGVGEPVRVWAVREGA